MQSMKNKNSTKYKSTIQEKRVAKDLNAKVTVASGALWTQKADVRSDDFLIECKTTAKDFYSLTTTTWSKIKKQALNDNFRIPVMCIDLEDGKESIAIMSIHDFIATGFDLKAQFLGNPEPIFIEKNSYRVTADFIGEDFPQAIDDEQYPCYRRDIKFLGTKEHLVLIKWKDFIYFVGK